MNCLSCGAEDISSEVKCICFDSPTKIVCTPLSDPQTQEATNVPEYKNEASEEIAYLMKSNMFLLEEIKVLITDRLQNDTVKETAFNKLYDIMKSQKENTDYIDRILKPYLLDLLLLYDSMAQIKTACFLDKAPGDINKSFDCLESELLEILYRQEVARIEDTGIVLFDSKIHKAVKTEQTNIEGDDYKISSIIRSGFMWRDKLLRPQEVIIKRFKKGETNG